MKKTTETSAGVSFGMSGETSFQSGNTLMRKVKCVQYDLTGKAFEYNFDLGRDQQDGQARGAGPRLVV